MKLLLRDDEYLILKMTNIYSSFVCVLYDFTIFANKLLEGIIHAVYGLFMPCITDAFAYMLIVFT